MKIVRVISGKAGLRLAACFVPSKEDDYNYWFDETGSVESPVKSTTAYKKEWFETVAEVTLMEQGINDNATAAKKAKDAADKAQKDATAAGGAAKKAQETADEALKAANSGSAYSESFKWKQDTEKQYKDIFKLSGFQSIMPLNGYSILWIRQNPTTQALENKISPPNENYGLSSSAWRDLILLNLEDESKPSLRVISCPVGDDTMLINVTSIEVTDAVQK